MDNDLTSVLLEQAIRAAGILGVAFTLTAAMRRASAASRHLVWTCAIVAVTLLPLGTAAPRWQVLLPSVMSRALPPPAPPEAIMPTEVAPVPFAASGEPRPPMRATSRAGIAGRRIEPLVIGWSVGTLVVLLYLAAGQWTAWRMRRTFDTGTPHGTGVRRAADALQINRACIVRSSRVTTPMVTGWWRPLILLPAAADTWGEERARAVLLHEVAHIIRRDCLSQAMAGVVCAAHWCNPLAWVALRQMRIERERACDDAVLKTGIRGSDYARHLVDIAEAAPFRPLLARTALPMAASSELTQRVAAILDSTVCRSSRLTTRCVCVAAIVLTAAPVAAVQFARQDVRPHRRGIDPIRSAPRVDRPAVVLGPTAPLALPVNAPIAQRLAAVPADGEDRAAWACGHGSVRDASAVPELIALLADGTPLPPRIFCGTKAPFEDESWSPRYAEVFEPSPGEAAARALLAIGDAAVGPLTVTLQSAAHWRARKNAAWVLGYSRGASDALINALTDPAWQVRAQAAFGLLVSGAQAPHVIAALTSALYDTDARVREQAAAALGHKGGGPAVDALLIAVRDGHSQVRRAAVASLWHSADPRALAPLFDALRDEDDEVRAAAAGALGNRAGDPEVQLLIASRHDPDPRVRAGVNAALEIVERRMLGTTNLTRVVIPRH